MRRWQLPAPPSVLVGRARELARIKEAHRRLGVAVLFGVPGVGKSALATAYAADFGEAAVHVRCDGTPLAGLLDDVRRQLARGLVPELGSLEERTLDIASRLDDERALLLLEDVHEGVTGEVERVVDLLAGQLRRGRVIVTSRQRIARRPGGADRLEIQLGELDAEEAGVLWSTLDELYGPSGESSIAIKKVGGNPFLLRRAHAGGLDDEDPIRGTLAALSPEERSLARLLARLGRRTPATAAEVWFGSEGRALVKSLVSRLILDVDGALAVGLHGLFRETILADLSAEEARACSHRLADTLPALGFDAITTVRETVRQRVFAEQFEQAGALLQTHAAELIREGAGADLVTSIEQIPESKRTSALVLALARGRSRSLEHERAYADVRTLHEREPENLQAHSLLATHALTTGRVAEARKILCELTTDLTLEPATRREAWRQRALTHFHEGEDALAEEAICAAEGGPERPFAAYFSVMTKLLVDTLTDAHRTLVERAAAVQSEDAPPYTTRVLFPLLIGGAYARLGRRDAAERVMGPAFDEAKLHEDLQTQTYVARLRAELLLCQGDRMAALSVIVKCTEAYRRGGSLLGYLTGSVAVSKLLFMLGKTGAADALAAECKARAQEAGLVALARAFERSRERPPLGRLRSRLGRSGGKSVAGGSNDHASDRALDAAVEVLARVANGEPPRGGAIQLPGAGYAVERIFDQLAHATSERLAGRSKEATRWIAEARASAQREAVDPTFVDDVLEIVGSGRVVTSAEKRATTKAVSSATFELVLDGGLHVLRTTKVEVNLAKKPTLRKLLYALASRPNEAVSKSDLAGAIWPGRYDPLRHDGALWVNLRRLRQLLEPALLSIELAEDGYRLVVPASFVFLEPGTPNQP